MNEDKERDEQEAIRGYLDGMAGWMVARCGRGGVGHVAPRSASDIMRRLHGPERGDITAFSQSWVPWLYLESGFGKVGNHCLGILILQSMSY